MSHLRRNSSVEMGSNVIEEARLQGTGLGATQGRKGTEEGQATKGTDNLIDDGAGVCLLAVHNAGEANSSRRHGKNPCTPPGDRIRPRVEVTLRITGACQTVPAERLADSRERGHGPPVPDSGTARGLGTRSCPVGPEHWQPEFQKRSLRAARTGKGGSVWEGVGRLVGDRGQGRLKPRSSPSGLSCPIWI